MPAVTAGIESSEMPRTAEAFVVAPGEDRMGGPIYVLGNDIFVKISSQDTGGAFTVFEGVVGPHAGPPLHMHREQDEWWQILEGDFLFEVDGQQLRAKPGDIVFAPKGRPHTFQNVGETPGRTLTTVVPGGVDLFFQELSAVAPRGSVPQPAKMMPLFKKYNHELLGPPLAVRDSGVR